MDVADEAALVEARHIEQSLANHKRQNKQQEPLVIDGERCCVDCDLPINKKRLAFIPTAVRCAECEGYHERQR